MNKQSLIQTVGLTKNYVNDDVVTPVLHELDLTIDKGEFVAIMGPSGSGKSTLMHILGFLDTPTSGSYRFEGMPVEQFTDDELAVIRVTKVSFVFQSFNLLARTTVLDNVMLPLLYHPHVPAAEREERARKAIAKVGLGDRIGNLSNQLSGGQQQRVAIARALVTEPELIFADEPTGNLDSASGIAVMTTLQSLHDAGHTIILVTHESETAAHAQRILHIRDGRIVKDDRKFQRVLASKTASLK